MGKGIPVEEFTERDIRRTDEAAFPMLLLGLGPMEDLYDQTCAKVHVMTVSGCQCQHAVPSDSVPKQTAGYRSA